MAAFLRTVHGINDIIATFCGLVCNFLLIYMIVKTRNKELKKYNRIMLQCTLIDIFLNIMTFVARPIVVTQDGQESIIINPLIRISRSMEQIFSVFWVFALFYSICALPTSFFYRYRILCLNKTFPTSLQMTCLSVSGFISVTYAGHYYYAFCVRTKDYLKFAENLAPWFASEDGRVNAIAIVGGFDNYIYIFMTHAVILTVGTYIVIISLSWKVYKFMKYHKSSISINANFFDIQNQLTKTLIAQSIIPLFTFALPIIFIIVTVTLPIHISPEISATTSVFFSYIPMGNALSMLFFVKSYRKRGYMILKQYFNQIFFRSSITVTITDSRTL